MENNFLGLIENSVKEYWSLPVFTDYEGKTFLYSDFAAEITKLHILFREAGIEQGDKIALIGRNSASWGITLFAVLSYGAVAVPLLHEFTSDNVHNLVNHSEAKILLAARYNIDKLDHAQMPGVQVLMLLEDLSVVDGPDHVKAVSASLHELFLKQYPDFKPEDLRWRRDQPEELAIINYTSGTTGFSKGVMLPYRSLWSNTVYAIKRLPFVHEGDKFVCMLPMAHMYGLAFEILDGVSKGCHIHFLPRVPSPSIVVNTFKKIRPALVVAVPLIIEKIVRNRVFPALKQPVTKLLYAFPLTKPLVKKKILTQLNDAFGGCFEEIIIGGAAFNKEVESFLKSIGFRYTIGYGMTECGPLISYEQWDSFKKGSVGKVVDRMEVKIDAKEKDVAGEILVRGSNVMLGYYKNPEATREVFTDDGWMHTGDLGMFDNEGFLSICGRSKTMLLGSNGQNIYPEEIESILNAMPYIAESLIVAREGSEPAKTVLTALIYPEYELANKDGLTHAELTQIMKENISTLNSKIPYYSKIGGYELRETEFEKTPKQSIRRFLYK
ncbi:MAG: AMP-binding protein [Dysgonamonadaceae bacterium]|jgi:long-chain acyl-CoA synthetase|nr:AMP-binding protein [Dysgonamonadaceae bacterium]